MNIQSFLKLIKLAYPEFIDDVYDNKIHLNDGSVIDVNLEKNQLTSLININNLSDIDRIVSDCSRIRLHELLSFMYGNSEEEVKRNLVEVNWLPRTINKKILITSVNDVHKKLQQVSSELDALPRKFKKYVTKLSGTFSWRKIQGTNEQSSHAYGIAIDINKKYGRYWKWDIHNDDKSGAYNKIPYQIIRAFEKHGFIWGGRWTAYDTMHFEYRPEFLIDRKKRVLILSRGGLNYGSEMQLARLINNLDQSKYELHLITTEGSSGNVATYSESIFDLPAWGKLKNLISKYRAVNKLLNYAKQENIDLIHCSYQWLYPYARFVGKKLNIPVLLHIRRPNNKPKSIKRYVDADKIICVSRRIYQEFLTAGCSSERLLLIPDAISEDFQVQNSKSEAKSKLGLDKKFVVAIVGRIYKNKKHHLFIQLANYLTQSRDDVEFLIVGKVDDDNYYQHIKAMANDSQAKITFTGHTDDMSSIFNAIDVLVSFSGGSVMYEAMAWAKIVISVGFVKQNTSTYLMHRKTAFVIDSESIQLAADTISEVLSDKELFTNVSSEASKLIKQNLLPKTLSNQIEKLYDNL